jgi:type IV pilus assembly protein PilQ
MLKWLEIRQAAVFCTFCLVFVLLVAPARAETTVAYGITDIGTTLSDGTLTYTLSGASPPIYTVSERFAPFRVVIDVAGAFIAAGTTADPKQLPENGFVTLEVTDRKDQEPAAMRFMFTLADSHDYTVTTTEQNQLQVRLFPATTGKATTSPASSPGQLTLQDLNISSTPNSTTIALVASSRIENYNVGTIGGEGGRPPRMFIDIDNVAGNLLAAEEKVGTSVDKIRVAPRGNGVRLVFDSASAELFRYAVAPSPEGLQVVIDEAGAPVHATAAKTAKATATSDATLDQLIDSTEKLLGQDTPPVAASKAAALKDDFTFSGYQKQRISVDFFKIDIHNVFRLFRQITNLNIIVDEEVRGSLTLALNDVPWDFALDIILNLMDLKKEERFNTIVIYPSKKEFVWPTRAEDNLAFEADVEVIEEEALVIEKAVSEPPEVVQAKELMAKAASLEAQEQYENAVIQYGKAYELWPENNRIANKLANIYLVNLGLHAKAMFYARESLRRDPGDTRAALYAGIAAANMQRTAEAKEYFTQAISGSPPMQEALLSYAAFSENNGLNEPALQLIDTFHEYYSESVDTMVAKARLLDKLARKQEASTQYRSILASGFTLRPDLRRYIEGRLAAQDN